MTQASQSPTTTSLPRIWGLVWPQVLMGVFHFLVGVVDVWVAGRISSDVQASLGMINQLLLFLLIVAMAVSTGSVAAISQSMGAGLTRRMLRYVGLVLELALAAGLLIVVVGLALKEPLMDLLQVPRELAPVTGYYMQIFMLLLPSYYLLIISNSVFRAQKLVHYPLYAMITVTVVNTAADFTLALGWGGLPAYGYKGLAWATFAAVNAGMLMNLVNLGRLGLLRPASFPPVRWIKRACGYLVKVAWPMGVVQVVWHSAYLVLFAITASLPEGNVVALAGFTAGIRVESALFLPGMAFNMTAGILMGQLLGERRTDEAKRTVYRILALGAGVMSVLAVAVWAFVWPIAGFLAPDPAVQAEAVNYLRYNLLAIPFTMTSMILAGSLAGAGATFYNLFGFGLPAWLVRIPLAFVLGHLVLGRATGVWAAMLASQVVQAAVMLYIFQFRDWSRFAMIKQRRESGDKHETVISAGHPRASGRVS
jgi:MATE family multidrug resistance protein